MATRMSLRALLVMTDEAPVRSRNIVNFHVFEKFYEAPSDHNADGARRKD
jgi:hypothetical protein